MFDNETASFIRTVPPLRGLNTDALPELLTRAHSEIAALRLRVREARSTGHVDLSRDIALLRRLARTYMAYATVMVDDIHRGSAAYVAASAYQLIGRAGRAGIIADFDMRLSLSRSYVPPELSSLLLFLAAGYPSDAREVADAMSIDQSNGVGSSFRDALIEFAHGDLRNILSRSSENVELIYSGDDPATAALYQRLLTGLKSLASDVIQSARPAGAESAASEIFREVQRLSIAPASPLSVLGEGETSIAQTQTIYSGPYHIASLLLDASDQLLSDRVTAVMPPSGVNPGSWDGFTQRIASHRPFLWSNHKEALEAGFLDPGISAVVSYPTGAGKSTLSELKIAACAYRGRKVIFLAPTRALVWQTSQALRRTFPDLEVTDSPIESGAYEETDTTADTDLVVTTPERCLQFLSSEPSAFETVGLIVFDECHLLHPRNQTGDRRSLDAMLCMLGLLDRSPKADVLMLSAMLGNTDELAKWISYATGRRCLNQTTSWKPTRQARGCLVYPINRIRELTTTLRSSKRTRKTKGPTVELKRQMTAPPYALFGLTQTWQKTLSKERFSLFRLSDDPVTLGVNSQWKLVSNKNHVAAELAAKMAIDNIKVIVFVQNKTHCRPICASTANAFARQGFELTAEEKLNRVAAIDDLGDEALLLGPVGGVAAPHNSLLLPSERRLNENAFARSDGLNVLVATPTLAQGMNLPAEAVIMCGGRRFDTTQNDHELVAAHELLNAAGRAGRAGHHAAGIVLFIPDSIISASDTLTEVNGPLTQLVTELFSKTDQCLRVDDPIERLLDRVEVQTTASNSLLRYFLTKLPVGTETEDTSIAASRILGRSFASYRAQERDSSASFVTKLERALAIRRGLSGTEELLWINQISSSSGLPPARVAQVDRALTMAPISGEASVADCVDWLFEFFATDETLIEDLFDETKFRLGLSEDEVDRLGIERSWSQSYQPLKERLLLWMRGATIAELERDLTKNYDPAGFGAHARQFATQFVLELASFAGMVGLVRRRQLQLSHSSDDTLSLALGLLSPLIREGFDDPVKLAVRYVTDVHRISRRQCHRLGQQILADDPELGNIQSFADIRSRVRPSAIAFEQVSARLL